MMSAKLFENGRSQAVRLPKEFRFEGTEVNIAKIGSCVILIPKEDAFALSLAGLDMFSDDFMAEGREQEHEQERESL